MPFDWEEFLETGYPEDPEEEIPALTDRYGELEERYPEDFTRRQPPPEYMYAMGSAGGFEYFGDPEEMKDATGLMDMRSVEDIEASTKGYEKEAERHKAERLEIEKPPGTRPPNYDNREGFEQKIFEKFTKQYGFSSGNPYEIDLDAELKKHDAELPDLFNYIFRGRVNWIDKDRLDKDQQKYWDNTVKQFHAERGQKILSAVSRMKNEHNYYMTKFDTAKKEYDVMLEKARKEREDLAKEKLTIYNTINQTTMPVTKREWLEKYQHIEGWTREAPKWKPEGEKPINRLQVIAQSVGVDLTKPITKEEADKVVKKLQEMGDSFLEKLFQGQLMASPPITSAGKIGFTKEKWDDYQELLRKKGEK